MRDFGTRKQTVNLCGHEVELESNAIIPGYDLHDLVVIFEEAENSEGVNNLSANPSNWGTIRGIKAVVETCIEAMENYYKGN